MVPLDEDRTTDPLAPEKASQEASTNSPVGKEADAASSSEYPSTIDPNGTRQPAEETPADLAPTQNTSAPVDLSWATSTPTPAEPSGGAARSLPRRFGNYELLEKIGHGGMGVVYKARQLTTDRLVAVKMILSGAWATPDTVERFHREARAAAHLDHPGIVQVYESGQIEGQHFFSMAYVQGASLQDLVREGPLPPRDAGRLVQEVAAAVQYAHKQGIIHRDIKPHNVLVPGGGVEPPGDSRPRLTDFGLARLQQSDLSLTGEVMGTPSYMPPEQARGKIKEIGPTTDVYSLGAVLYCLLTGRPPFQSADPYETIRQVCEKEPIPPRQLNPGIPRDLETVCLKCLEKEPHRRYQSAQGLAEELHRFQTGQPVLARPVGALERSWRWCRRNPAMAGLLGLVAITLLLGTGVSWFFALRAQANEAEARIQEKEARKKAQEEASARQQAHKETLRAEQELERARAHLMTAQLMRVAAIYQRHPAQARELLHDYTAIPINRRDFAWGFYERLCNRQPRALVEHTDYVHAVAFSPNGSLLASGSRDLTVRLWDVASSKPRATLEGHTQEIQAVAFSPDGKTLASGSVDRTVKLWDVEKGQLRATLSGHKGYVYSVAFSPDGKLLVSGGGPFKGSELKLWDLTTGKERASLKGHRESVLSVAFSPDGKLLASASVDETIRLWDVASGEHQHSLRGHSQGVGSVTFNTDGNLLVSGGMDGMVRLWDVATGQQRAALEGHAGAVNCVTFSPDGKTVASASIDKTVKLWDVAAGTLRTTLPGHTDRVRVVAFAPDGKVLASAGWDRTVKLWEVNGGQELATLDGHDGPVYVAAISPDNQLLASASGIWNEQQKRYVGEIKLWDLATRLKRATLQGHAFAVLSVAFSPDGKVLASASQDKTVKLWEVATGKEFATLKGHADMVTSVVFSSDGQTLASGSGMWDEKENRYVAGEVKLWDVSTKKETASFKGHKGIVHDLAFSPDGKLLASGSEVVARNRTAFDRDISGEVKLWEVTTGQEVIAFKGHSQGAVRALAFSPDGNLLATASGLWDGQHRYLFGEVKLWEVANGKEKLSFRAHTDVVHALAFSPDGQTLATGSRKWDKNRARHVAGEVKLWGVTGGKERAFLKGHLHTIWAVVFSPDGKILASGSEDKTIKLWDPKTGQFQTTLHGHRDRVKSLAFNPDSTLLASASDDGTVRLWDLKTGEELALLRGHTHRVSVVAFSPDGKTLASGSWDKTVRLWDVATRQMLATLEGHTATVYGLAFSPDGKTLTSGGRDKVVKLWEVATGQPRGALKGHTDTISAVVFSPDGKTLAAASGDVFVERPGVVHLWDVATGKLLRSMTGPTSGVHGLAFSPDGKLLATGSGDMTVKLWDVSTGQVHTSFQGHTDRVYTVAFSPDGKVLASGSGYHDETVKLWDVDTSVSPRPR